LFANNETAIKREKVNMDVHFDSRYSDEEEDDIPEN